MKIWPLVLANFIEKSFLLFLSTSFTLEYRIIGKRVVIIGGWESFGKLIIGAWNKRGVENLCN